jgi:hypothetical protein
MVASARPSVATLPKGHTGDDVHQWQESYLVCRIVDVGCKFSPVRPGDLLIIKQNMHELACVSGIAAAYRLGAEYVKFDDFAEDFFSKYLLVSHGVRYKGGKKAQ